MKNTNIITTVNTTNNTDTNNIKGVITMTNTRTRKHSFKTRFIAGILSAITIFSVASVSVTSVSAAKKIEVEEIGINAADEAFNAIGDLVPGGKILLSPFKTLFHAGVDSPDPLDEISDKLDNVDNKLDQLDSKLDDLNANINKNTQWMGQKIQNTADMSELRSDFRNLSPQVAKLVKDVKAVETNPKLNKTQKIMRLATITDTQRYDNVTTYVYNIQKAMDGSDSAYVDMYKALYTKYALTRMFAREAYRDALPTAQALTAQYVYAAVLMDECQTASKAVAQFTDKDIEALGSDSRLYDAFDIYRHSLDNADPEQALIAAANGAKKFKANYDRPAYINKDPNTSGKAICFGTKSGYAYANGTPMSINYKDVTDSNALTPQELNNIADYIRTNYPGRSINEVLCEDLGISRGDNQCYIIVNADLIDTKTRNTSIDFRPSWGASLREGYDRTKSVKAIFMCDRGVKVENLLLYTYHSWDIDNIFGQTIDRNTGDYSSYYRTFMTVSEI